MSSTVTVTANCQSNAASCYGVGTGYTTETTSCGTSDYISVTRSCTAIFEATCIIGYSSSDYSYPSYQKFFQQAVSQTEITYCTSPSQIVNTGAATITVSAFTTETINIQALVADSKNSNVNNSMLIAVLVLVVLHFLVGLYGMISGFFTTSKAQPMSKQEIEMKSV